MKDKDKERKKRHKNELESSQVESSRAQGKAHHM